jgi:hypothetical protein
VCNRCCTFCGSKSEQFTVGILDIGIARNYQSGSIVDETYFYKKKMVTRAKYEMARVDHLEMPAANMTLVDHSVDLLKGARKEQKEARDASKHTVIDATEKLQIDKYCQEQIAESKDIEAFNQYTLLLGERTEKVSGRSIKHLFKSGVVKIFVGKAEVDGESGYATAGTMIVELPEDSVCRKKIFSKLNRLIIEIGYPGVDPDCGQRFAFLMLD